MPKEMPVLPLEPYIFEEWFRREQELIFAGVALPEGCFEEPAP
ncbi:MAG: hypothetical protein AAF481_06435 [Acidobacteriota bacterium]